MERDFLKELFLDKVITLCIHCGSEHIVHNGKFRGRQRFKCKVCKRTFNTLSDTPLARTRHLDKWLDFANCLENGLSLRKSAKIVNVSYVSLFYWRHKLLTGLNNIPISSFTDKVEMQDMYLLISQKGGKKILNPRRRGYSVYSRKIFKDKKICVLIAKDVKSNIFSRITNYGLLDLHILENFLNNYISADNTICSKMPRIFKQLAIVNKAKYFEFPNLFQRQNYIPDILTYEKKFKLWIQKFKGVSTKYLDNYLALFKFLYSNNKHDNLAMLIVSSSFNEIQTFNSIRKATVKYF